jgi:hypothetical protein
MLKRGTIAGPNTAPMEMNFEVWLTLLEGVVWEFGNAFSKEINKGSMENKKGSMEIKKGA